MKKTIMYDATVLINAMEKGAGRTGIFWTAYNVARMLIANKNVNLIFYIESGQVDRLKTAIEKCMPEFKNVKIYIPTNRTCLDRMIDFFSLQKQNAKQNGKKILANLFHIVGLLSKIIFFIPRKLLKLKKNRLNTDVFFSPIFKVPDIVTKKSEIKNYTILYDTIPFIFPEYYKQNGDLNKYWLSILSRFMAKNNKDKYFAISESTKYDFLKLIPSLNPEQIIVTPLACSDNFYPCDKKQTLAALKKYNLPTNKKYVFSLCSLEPRKNLIRAVKTFIEFIKKNKIDDMVFIMGGGQWDSFIGKLESEIKDLGKYRNKIIRAGYIDDEDLAPLYSGAQWFVYTSQYEGFGLPPLEAMQCGTPVITSNNSSLPEVVGDAGIMIDWDNDEQHIAAYEKYYFDEKYRTKMARAGLKRAKDFSWKKTVDLMLKEIL